MKTLLFILALLLGLVVTAQWLDWPGESMQLPPPLTDSTRGEELPPQTPGEYPPLGPLEAYRVIAERPLFVAGRRPRASSDSLPAPDEPAAFPLQLSGIVITPRGREALLMDKVNRQVIRLAEGESYQQWTVVRITADKMVVIRQDQREEILLRVFPEAPERPPGKPSQNPAREREKNSEGALRKQGQESESPPHRQRDVI